MADRARRIGAESLDERLPVEDPADEFGRLAEVFNGTLSRLQGSFERLRRFTADASHELRTPLTAMRSVGEVALQRPLDGPTYREVIGSMLEEVERLTHLVDGLLVLARADSGRLPAAREAVDLGTLAAAVAEQLRAGAFEVRISSGISTSGIRFRKLRLTAPMTALKPNNAVNCHGREGPARQPAARRKVRKLARF